MATDATMTYLGAAVRLAGINRFYTRRVLQRCERGELTLLDAAELLVAEANRQGATIEAVAVGTASSRASTAPRF